MKMFSHIIVAFTMLIILTFGGGGVSLVKCACSGRTSIVLPLERGCCPEESGCMTVEVVPFSASEMQQSVDIDIPVPEPMMLPELQTAMISDGFRIQELLPVRLSGQPPTEAVGTMVLRV